MVAEDVSPSGDRQLGRADDGGVFVAAGDELEEQVRCFGFFGDVADSIDNQQRMVAQTLEICT